jgi:protein-disulfide isomerase
MIPAIHLSLRASARALAVTTAAFLFAACGPDAPATERSADAATRRAGAGRDVVVEAPAAKGSPARVVLHGVDLTGVGYDVGDPRAPIVMVELSDFGCPYCAQHARETFPSIDDEFIATGKVFYKHVPFVMGMFPNGDRAARAAECAGEQERFWPMHDSIYVHQRDWKRGNDPDGVLGGLARQVVPDAQRWAACYAEDRREARTAAANIVARKLGVRATPTFFIHGQMVEGALPLPAMREGLNGILRELGGR